MGRSIGDTLEEGFAMILGLVSVGIVIVVALIYAIVNSIAEDAVWNAAGEILGAAGQGGLQAAWGLLGIILSIVAIVGFVLWAKGKVEDSF